MAGGGRPGRMKLVGSASFGVVVGNVGGVDSSGPVEVRLSVGGSACWGQVAAAQRDLSSRRADQVRSPKLLWRMLGMNTLGTFAYLWSAGAVARPPDGGARSSE